MALVRINLQGSDLVGHDTSQSVSDMLASHTGTKHPVVIMIHGFKFEPGHNKSCPHEHILSLDPVQTCWKAKSWPRALGLGQDGNGTLGIAFGWPARGSIWQAYERARLAGRALASLIALIRQLAPERPVHILAHSLGARVALGALPYLPAGALDRMVFLAGAELTPAAEAALDTPCGRTTEVISVTSRENRPYDRLLENLLGKSAKDRAIGRTGPERRNWLTLRIGDREVLIALRSLGFDIPPPLRWFCHWSSYLRPGVFTLYAALIARPSPLSLAHLRIAAEAGPEPCNGPSSLSSWWHIARPAVRAGRAAG